MKNRSKLENPLNKWYNWLFEANDLELIKSYTKALSHNSKNVKQITKKKKKSKYLRKFLKLKKMLHLRCYIV